VAINFTNHVLTFKAQLHYFSLTLAFSTCLGLLLEKTGIKAKCDNKAAK